MQSNHRLAVSCGIVVFGLTLSNQSAQAQVTADATAGTVVAAPVGGVVNITVGTLSPNAAGDVINQFHSFSQFDVNTGQTANFIPAPDVNNILARVTGPGASIINGQIQVFGGVANSSTPGFTTPNLFLMNPSGIIFGPTSSLNVTASFVATTASSIGLTNNAGAASTYFNATPPAGGDNFATLQGVASNMVFAPGFTGSVVNLSNNLRVPAGQILGLYGNSVASGGDISSPGSYVSAYSVPSPRTMRYTIPGNLLTLEYPTAGSLTIPAGAGTALGAATPVTLAQLVTGGNFGNAATVRVVGGNVVLTGGGAAGADATVAQGELGVRNVSVSGAAAAAGGPTAGAIRLYSAGNLTAGNISSQATASTNAANNTLGFGGDVQLYAGAGGPGTTLAGATGGAVQVGNITANGIDLRAGNAAAGNNITGGNFTTAAGVFTPNQATSIQVRNLGAGNITLGNVTSNNVNPTPAAGQSGGGNILIRSTNNLVAGNVTNNTPTTANLPNGGGDIALISGLNEGGSIDVNGITTVGNVQGASININSGSTIAGGNFTTQGFTAPGRATAIDLTSRRGGVTVRTLLANNYNAQGQAAGGGNVIVNARSSIFTATDRITAANLAGGPNSAEKVLATSVSTGGPATALSAVSLAARGNTTINQLGAPGSSFIQGGGLQVDTKNIMIYRLASNPSTRVLISGINPDGSFQLTNTTTGAAIPSGSIIIREAVTNTVGAGGGTNGLVIRLNAVATPLGGNTVGGIAGEPRLNTAVPAPAAAFAITTTPNPLRLQTLPSGAIADLGTEGPVAAVSPTVPVTGALPVSNAPNGSVAEVERTPKRANDLAIGQFSPILTAEAIAAASAGEGVLTLRVARQVPVVVAPPVVVPDKKAEAPEKVIKQPVKIQVLPQLW
jgi:filamentous hemagglutinin family protein